MAPSRALRWTLEALVAITLLVTALPLVSAHWWVLDLFTHFRLQLIAAQAVLVTLLVLARSARVPILLLAIGANAFASRDYLIPRTRATQTTADLRVMEANVRVGNKRVAGLLAQIDRARPDIVIVVEFTSDWDRALAPLAAHYPYRVTAPRSDPFGIAVFSRTPFLEARIVDLQGVPAIDARLGVAGEPTRVIAIHAVPPTSHDRMARQVRQLAQLKDIAATVSEPLLIVGDFNLTPFSPRFGDFLDATGLRDALAGHGPSITWPSYFPLLGIAIDHCLLGPDWASIAHRRQPDYGSDHYAIVVDLIRATPR